MFQSQIEGSEDDIRVKNDLSQKRKSQQSKKISGLTKSVNISADYKNPLVRFPKNSKDEKFYKVSEFIKEMTMSLQDRLFLCGKQSSIPEIIEFVDIGENSCHKETQVPVDQPLFHANPSHVVYQSYQPFQTYEAILCFRNRDRVARRLKVETLDSPYFSLENWNDGPINGGRVAPGMEASFILKFSPDSTKDYACQVICHTDRENFVVPIKAIGSRGILDFPDEIHFGSSPVKFKNTKTILVRNIGNSNARIIVDAPEPFSVDSERLTVLSGQSIQFNIHFKPLYNGGYDSLMKIFYETGEKIAVRLFGESEDADIKLEQNKLHLDNTYISLASSKTVRIFNNSSIIVPFSWKRFATLDEEEDTRSKAIEKLEADEKKELEKFYEQVGIIGGFQDLPGAGQISKRYINKRREIEFDKFLFANEILCVEPIEGEIWPNSFCDINIVFQPQKACNIVENIYCDIAGRESRLCLTVRGEGIGPIAKFPFDCIDIESVFIHSNHVYKINLENKGGIDVIYHFRKSETTFGSKFSFTPSDGRISLNGTQDIVVEFKPNILGEFYEEFICSMEGSDRTLKIAFRGRVVGPTFYFESDTIDFGSVSYGFPSSTQCKLHNSSEIEMQYCLNIETDGGTDDFKVVPSQGVVKPFSFVNLTVQFHPTSQKDYNGTLSIDILEVLKKAKEIKIHASVVIPVVKLMYDSIDLRDCYLDFAYESEVQLENNTSLPAKFQFVSSEIDHETYKFKAKDLLGVIMPFSKETLKFEVLFKRLGMIQFSVFISTLGNETPLELSIRSFAIGPNVVINSTKVDFGKVSVLSKVHSSVQLKNESLIPANFICELSSSNSVFSVHPQLGCLQPNETIDISISAFLDDHAKFQDTLKVGVQHGGVMEVQLLGKGTGSTIWFDEKLKRIDFGNIFTNRTVRKEFRLINKGRRPQLLVWSLEEIRGSKKANANMHNVFSVIPNRFLIQPMEEKTIFIEALSSVPIEKAREMIMCQCTIDKDPSKHNILGAELSATFVRPLVQLSLQSITFHYKHTADDSPKVLSKDLTLKNVSALPLRVSLSTQLPFSVIPDKKEYMLLPSEEDKIIVRFDSTIFDSKESYETKGKVIISYIEHPQKDIIELKGKVSYPNISIDTSEIDFGCIEVGTEHRKKFIVKNSAILPVDYIWYFVNDVNPGVEVDIENVFDISPLQGTIIEDEEQEVEVSFYPTSEGLFQLTAVCEVRAGPIYKILLKGQSSFIKYELDNTVLDFGKMLFLEHSEKYLSLLNTGNVTLQYRCIIPENSQLQYRLVIYPELGYVNSNSKQKISVKFCPCIPDITNAYLLLQIAHFEPIKIFVKGEGMFSHLQVNLPVHEYSKGRFIRSVKTDVSSAQESSVLDTNSNLDAEADSIRTVVKEKISDLLRLMNPGKLIFHNKDSKQRKPKDPIFDTLNSLSIIDYICDFGNVVKNATKKRNVRLFNNGPLPISINIDRSQVKDPNFSVEPDKIRNLEVKEAIDLQLVYNAKIAADNAKAEAKITLYVTNGCTISILMKATVSVPDLQVGCENIDFGDIATGFRKTKSFLLTNVNSVPCDWTSTLIYYEGVSEKKRRRKTDPGTDDFIILPREGIIQPGEKTEVVLKFTPSKARKYEYELHLRIGMNPKPFLIKISASSYKPIIKIEPSNIVLPSVLPYFDGKETKFTIENPTTHPIEVFSLEFDKQYREEEETLSKIDGYENGVIYLNPRTLGAGLPQEILSLSNEKVRISSADSNKSTSSPKEAANEQGLTSQSPTKLVPLSSPNTEKNAVVFKQGLGPINVIIYGPPLSGKTSQAQKISKYYNLKLIQLDKCIENIFFEGESAAEGTLPRRVFEAITQMGLDKWLRDRRFNDMNGKHRMEDDYIVCENPLQIELLSEIIAFHLNQEDAQNGFILDGLDSCFIANPVAVLKEILKCIPDKRNSHIVILELAGEVIFERKKTRKELLIKKEKEQLANLEDISEGEYESMTDEARKAFELKIKSLKKRIRDAKLGKDEIAHNPEDDDADENANEDRKGKDNKSPKKKDKGDKKSAKNQKNDKNNQKENQMQNLGGSSANLEEPTVVSIDHKITACYEMFLLGKNNIIEFIKEGDRAKSAQPADSKEKEAKKDKGKDKKQAQTHHEASNATSNAQDAHNDGDSNQNSGQKIEEVLDLIEINGNQGEDEIFEDIREQFPAIEQKSKDDETLDVFVGKDILEEAYVLQDDRSVDKFALTKNFVLQIEPYVEVEKPAPPKEEPAPPPQSAGSSGSRADSSKKKPLSAAAPKPVVVEETLKVVDINEEPKDIKQRWILKPKEKKVFSLRYYATDIGQYDQTLHFQVCGTGEIYELKCQGQCEYSFIDLDYKKMFMKWRKAREDVSIIHKEYIVANNTFEFGPLSINRPKDKNMDKSPDNRTTFKISNNTQMTTKVNFCCRYDNKGDIFYMEPSSMELPPNSEQDLNIWCYPKAAGKFDDTLLILIKDNPEVFSVKLTCFGVRPELELDKKLVQFDRLLLQRSDKKEIKIRNPTIMAAGWKLVGTDVLGEEFEVNPIEGVIEYGKETIVTVTFHATKPILVKRSIRLEVYDLERIGNPVQSENVIVAAEAYDISVDIHFPKGSEGGLDFGVLKVFDDSKQLVTLKNRGKYETGFRFHFEGKDASEFFMISPPSGILVPSDKTYSIQVIFKAIKEVVIKDNMQLKCLITEPSTSEVIASIPVKLNAKSVFSKYSILPARDSNFGSLVYGSKTTRQIIIENHGEFDFKFLISKGIDSDLLMPRSHSKTKLNAGGNRTSGVQKESFNKNSHNATNSPPPVRTVPIKTKAEIKQESSNAVAPFSIFPTAGTIPSLSKQIITVEFHPENPGTYEELLMIDISDRGPQQADAQEYRLIGECCMPGINTTDLPSIFEENSVRKRIDAFSMSQSFAYVEDEKVFYFGAFLVGQVVQTRFKITNPFKVPCEVNIVAKPRIKGSTVGSISGTAAQSTLAGNPNQSDFAFDVEPKRLTLPSHENRFVTVSFHPTAIQSYQGIFEAIVESVPDSKSKSLTFELRGEGTLPRIAVEKPLMRTKMGFPLLKFKRSLIGQSQLQPIVLKNEGIIPAKVKFDWNSLEVSELEFEGINQTQTILSQEIKTFFVKFKPTVIRKIDAELRLKVIDNSFEDTLIQLQAEGYMDDVSLDGLPHDSENELILDDCFVEETKKSVFYLRNNTAFYIKYSWTSPAEFTMSPSIGHIRPQGSKAITLQYTPKMPVKLSQLVANCSTQRIKYNSPSSTENDWDETLKALRWSAGSSKNNDSKRQPEPVAEPSHQIMENGNFSVTLQISATADYTDYECNVSTISFKTTLMYQTRVYSFPLLNIGKVRLIYDFMILDENGFEVQDSALNPFSVVPQQGEIIPLESQNITVKFNPTDVGHYSYMLVCNIQNLAKTKSPLRVLLKGSSLRPFCHFEIESKDYIISDKKSIDNLAATSSLDPSTRVIEIDSVGIKSKNYKKFYILNPTNIAYDFEWICETSFENQVNLLRCLTPRGSINGGKKYEICFEYVPETVDPVESFWKFHIAEHKILIPFLIICRAMEPNVYFDKTSFNFKSILVNCPIKETVRLMNQENTPFSFSFNETNNQDMFTSNNVLLVHPTSGTIPPHSEILVTLTFTPNAEKVYNFNLVCSVKRKPTSIILNIKGEGYAIHETLKAELPNGSLYLLSPGQTNNTIDFGPVYLNEKQTRRVVLENSGKFNYDFSWKINSSGNSKLLTSSKSSSVPPFITMVPDIGSVTKDDSLACEIQFLPTTTFNLEGTSATCLVLNGKSYKIDFQGSGVRPNIVFSETSHDFGPSFIFRPGMKALEHRFKISNRDQREISFDCTIGDSSVFEVQCGPSSLAPGTSGMISVFFYPRETKKYSDYVSVDLNGLLKVRLHVTGEGAEMKVELAQQELKIVSFGAVRVGHSVTKSMKIANKSIIPLKFNLGPAAVIESLKKKYITISPMADIVVRPKGVVTFEVKFHPTQRVHPFSEELFLECPGYNKSLFSINGTCHGIEVHLESDSLAFGAVVQRSSAVRRIQLQNSGDIGVKFKWDIAEFLPDFSITPPEGYISSGMEIPLDITFHPKSINQDIRYENLQCFIEGSSSLFLNLTGMCIPPVIQNDVVRFSVPVRESETKTIPIANKNNFVWVLYPVIDHEYWKCTDVLEIEPGQTKSLEVTYTPLEMTTQVEGAKHEGSVFLPMQDGSGMLIKLIGVADKPLAAATISRDIPCKTAHAEMLSVKNWLKKPQRFKVIIEQSKSDVSVILKGHNYIDIPALSTRDYKLNFFAYKEGVFSVRVIFKNEQTHEYIHYNLTFKSTPPGIISTIEMSTISRQPVTKDVTIMNPLPISVTFNAQCSHPDINVPPSFVISPRSEGACIIEFLPLQAKESTGKLTLSSFELGVFQYDLKLVATPAGAERSLHFKVGLGSSQTQTFRFISYCKLKTDYLCKIDSPDFSVDKLVVAPPATSNGVEVCVDILYEPSKIGDSRTYLSVTSPQGGDYLCPLFGHCVSPKPQGPFVIKPGASAAILFKNVSSQTATFNLNIDNVNFTVKNTETIGPKKNIHMNVFYKIVNPKASRTAKLIVTQQGSNVQWVYYLKSG